MGSRTRSPARRLAGRAIQQGGGAFGRERSRRQCTRSRRDARISYTFALFHPGRRGEEERRGSEPAKPRSTRAATARSDLAVASPTIERVALFKAACVNSDFAKEARRKKSRKRNWRTTVGVLSRDTRYEPHFKLHSDFTICAVREESYHSYPSLPV